MKRHINSIVRLAVLGCMSMTFATFANDVFVQVSFNYPDSKSTTASNLQMVYASGGSNKLIKELAFNIPNPDGDDYAKMLSLFIKPAFDNGKKIIFSQTICEDCKKKIDTIANIENHAIKTYLLNNKKINANDDAKKIKQHLKDALDTFFNVVNNTYLQQLTTKSTAGQGQDQDVALLKKALDNGVFSDKKIKDDGDEALRNITNKMRYGSLPIVNIKNNFSTFAQPMRIVYKALSTLGQSLGFSLYPLDDSWFTRQFAGLRTRLNSYAWTQLASVGKLAAVGVGVGAGAYFMSTYMRSSGTAPQSSIMSKPVSVPTPPTQPGFWDDLRAGWGK